MIDQGLPAPYHWQWFLGVQARLLDGVLTDRPNPQQVTSSTVGTGPKSFLDGAFGDAANWSNLFRPATRGSTPLLGRNTFRGPGFANTDASLFKEFRVAKIRSENLRVQFRAEFFNLFNRVNLRGPSNTLGTFNATTQRWSNVNFGRSTLAFAGRQIQFALKVVF